MPLSRIALSLAILAVAFLSTGCEALLGKAPPPRPHEAGGKFEDCAGCHRDGRQGAPVTDHHKRPNCDRCHAPRAEREES